MKKRRKDGLFQQNVTIGINPLTGAYIRKSIYAKTEDELEIKVGKIKEAVKNGTYADDSRFEFQAYAWSWLSRYKADPNLEKPEDSHTYRDYKNIIKNHLGPLKGKRLMKVKKQDIMAAVAELSGHYDLQRRLRMTVNQILTAAMDEGLIYKNVCQNVQISTAPKTKQRRFTQAEIDATMAAITSSPLLDAQETVMLQLLFYTGIRRGELLALTRRDISFDRKELNIDKAVKYPSNQARIGPPKSAAGVRKIELLSSILPDLEEYLQDADVIKTGFLFPGTKGRVTSLSIFRRHWQTIRTAVADEYMRLYPARDDFDWDGYAPHRFRHNFCSMLYDAGVPAVEAQKIMGHSDVTVTLNLYTHFDEEKAIHIESRLQKMMDEKKAAASSPAASAPDLNLEGLSKEDCLKLMQSLTQMLAGKL